MTRPRLGFLGVGWIGRHRLDAIAQAGHAEVAAIADLSSARRDSALAIAPGAMACEHAGQLLDHALDHRLDGVVIATPSALHAEHCQAALGRGLAVFCQKPLARDAAETARVVGAARAADRLLGVDLSYRHTEAIQRIRDVLCGGGIGRVFAVDLVFHNAYGPDAEWFYDRSASGGGCVIDLGIHLVDLALWLLGFPAVESVTSELFARGVALAPGDPRVEDYAAVQLRLAGGACVRLTCSWRISAGRDTVIEAAWYGTEGGLAMTNVAGSFYDFIAERYRGTLRERLTSPPDAWGGRAAVEWTRRLATGARFDPEAERLIDVARVLDAIYAVAGGARHSQPGQQPGPQRGPVR